MIAGLVDVASPKSCLRIEMYVLDVETEISAGHNGASMIHYEFVEAAIGRRGLEWMRWMRAEWRPGRMGLPGVRGIGTSRKSEAYHAILAWAQAPWAMTWRSTISLVWRGLALVVSLQERSSRPLVPTNQDDALP